MRGWSSLAAGAMLLTGFVVLFGKVAAGLVGAWATDGNYSHGFLVVPVALYFMWERRRRFTSAPAQPSVAGLIVVLGSIGVLAAGLLGSELFLTRISMLGALTGVIAFLHGWRRVNALAFPLGLLLLMIPIPAIVFNQVALPLQLLASQVGEFVLAAFAIPVLREGNVLVLATTSLEVAEACSGIRSLVSLLFLGIMLGYFSDPRAWTRTLITLSTVPVAILTNGLRVAGTGIAANQFGPAAAEGLVHTLSGWLVFVAACGLILSFARLLVRLAPPVPPDRARSADVGPPC